MGHFEPPLVDRLTGRQVDRFTGLQVDREASDRPVAAEPYLREPVLPVILYTWVLFVRLSMHLHKPKSKSFRCPSEVSPMFSGLMSLWMIIASVG